MANIVGNLLRKLIYGAWGDAPSDSFKRIRYKRIWSASVLLTILVSVTPLIVMTMANYAQYQRTLNDEILHPIRRLVSVNKKSLEYALNERKSALHFIINEKTYEELSDEARLASVLHNLKNSFGGFVDIGVIDSAGRQVSYVGPYELLGRSYKKEAWFDEVRLRGDYVSDVYLGFRKYPHFVIAVKKDRPDGTFHVLRATIDTDILNRQVTPLGKTPGADGFIVNKNGVLQTPSLSNRAVLTKSPFPTPKSESESGVLTHVRVRGAVYVMGYAYIQGSPFIFVITKSRPYLMRNWFRLRGTLVGFLAGSIFVIIILTMSIASLLVSRIREADVRHDKALHQMEYASKMASIGRLAAGVAHEINNPLAIINEKAGLLKDFVVIAPEFPNRERSLKLTDSIISSVERCAVITHRLLGFARHLDVRMETIDVAALLREVISFLEKEASYRNVEVQLFAQENIPTIRSDKGQLQQVFLNLLNNALAAVPDNGRVGVLIEQREPDRIAIVVSDNGAGIDEKDIDRVFEPFYTTKSDGTGLGLSITYGIIKKLRGEISVRSSKGHGSDFTVILPLDQEGS